MSVSNERLLILRDEIDVIDSEIARLFEWRMAAVSEVALVKIQAGLPVYDAEREKAVIERGRSLVSPQNSDGMERVLRELMKISKERQEELTIDSTQC